MTGVILHGLVSRQTGLAIPGVRQGAWLGRQQYRRVQQRWFANRARPLIEPDRRGAYMDAALYDRAQDMAGIATAYHRERVNQALSARTLARQCAV
jgi:hypothetical protein